MMDETPRPPELLRGAVACTQEPLTLVIPGSKRLVEALSVPTLA